MRWHYADPPLLWLYPATYAIHIAEELWLGQGYVEWMRLRGSPLSGHIVGNAAGLLLMILGIWLATHHSRWQWMSVTLAFAVLLNAGEHLRTSVVAASYSPGLASAFVLWIPLGLLTLLRAWDQASTRQWWGGILAATVIHGVVLSLAWGWRLSR
jgi:hypothetical protein